MPSYDNYSTQLEIPIICFQKGKYFLTFFPFHSPLYDAAAHPGLFFTKPCVKFTFFQIRFLDESSQAVRIFFLSQVRSFIQTGYLLFVQRLQKGKKVPLRRRFRICRSITKWANKFKNCTILFFFIKNRYQHFQFCRIIVICCLLFVALKLDQSQAS